MDIKIVDIQKEGPINFILGQSHFIKTVEDLYETIMTNVPNAEFGIAFCEASGERLIRHSGTNNEMIDYAIKNAENIACGHSFIIFIKNFFPINILNSIKMVPEVTSIYCATANPTKVVIAENDDQRGIIGILDGQKPLGVEDEDGKKWRKDILKKFNYKEN